jgi:hypothetical protein
MQFKIPKSKSSEIAIPVQDLKAIGVHIRLQTVTRSTSTMFEDFHGFFQKGKGLEASLDFT